MQKEVRVTYPKLRKNAGGSKVTFGVCEPIRKTLYDIFMDLKSLDRVTYIHRVIYAGKHNSPTELPVMFRNTINAVNKEYCREKLTGFLLIYNTFFVHVVEGSEDAIRKHLCILLMEPSDYSKFIGEMKLLIQISNVLRRLCPEWMTYHGTPSKLLTPLDKLPNVENTAHTLYKCLRQIYETIQILIRNSYEASRVRKSPVSHHESSINKTLSHSSSLPLSDNITLSTSAPTKNHYWEHLPEMELIESLVDSPYTQTLGSYYELFLDVSQREMYEDKVWPIPGDLIPYDVFSTTYENVTELTGNREDSIPKSRDELSNESKESSREDNVPNK